MNVLVLAAGSSDAYAQAGYAFPKNLIEISGKPLIQHVLENIESLFDGNSRLHVVVRQDEMTKFYTDQVIRLICADANIVSSPNKTSGAACTALLALEFINEDNPLLIVNGDQVLNVNHLRMVREFSERDLDGGIPVFEDVHPRYSFVRLGGDDLVIETAEKRPISNYATAGRYYFRSGKDFVKNSMSMMIKDAHVDGAFYVCPVYNQMILHGAKIGITRLRRSDYVNLATPPGITEFNWTNAPSHAL